LRALGIPKPKEWHIVANVLLSRPPLLVYNPNPLEKQVGAYLEMLEKHQYADFPLNFHFKQGSIAEKGWRQLHRRQPRRNSSGLLRDPTSTGSPQWILGGTSDEQVMKARKNAPPTVRNTENDDDDGLTDEERRDLEQFAAQEDEYEEMKTEVDSEIDLDFHRLERKPRETVYCLVKQSKELQLRSGKPAHPWGLPEAEATTGDHSQQEGLHMVQSLLAHPLIFSGCISRYIPISRTPSSNLGRGNQSSGIRNV
jgi:39S mitochondrial ribosomal protein L46